MRPKRSAGRLTGDIDMDLMIEDPRWNALDLETLAEQATSAALTQLVPTLEAVEVAILAVDKTRIAALNLAHRGKNSPTNVLSWPAQELFRTGQKPLMPQPGFDGAVALGDIAICYDTCAAEAQAGGVALRDHVTHLIVHGLLHLLGYDHENDTDAEMMERLEAEILGKLGIDDPYRA